MKINFLAIIFFIFILATTVAVNGVTFASAVIGLAIWSGIITLLFILEGML